MPVGWALVHMATVCQHQMGKNADRSITHQLNRQLLNLFVNFHQGRHVTSEKKKAQLILHREIMSTINRNWEGDQLFRRYISLRQRERKPMKYHSVIAGR